MKIKLKQMKLRYYLILFSVLVCSSNLNAQNNLNRITGLSSTTASVAYSLRQLSTSYTGPLVRIKVGTSFYDVYPDATTYNFTLSSKISASIGTYNAAVSVASVNALSTIVLGSTDATVAIWYDQSGNAVHVLSNTSTALIITAGSINTILGQPTIYFSGSNGQSLLTSVNTVNYSAQSGATVNAVAQNVATTSSFAGIIGAAYAIASPGYNIAYDATIGKGYASDGAGCTYGTNLSSTTPQIITNIFVNTTTNLSNTYINGVLKTSSGSTCALTHTSGSKIYLGSARGYGPASFIGNISEAIIFPSQLSDAVRNPLETNQSQTYSGSSVTIASSASGAVCAGTNVTYTASVSGISSPTYQWYKNGTAITVATSSTYSTTVLTNNDQIKVIVNGSINSNIITATISGSVPTITVNGDGCINKTSLTTTSGLTSYVWYKDNVIISGITTNALIPNAIGDYKVVVTNGSCSNTSSATTIYNCGINADGKAVSIANTGSLISREGGAYLGTAKDITGKVFNTTSLTTLGAATIGSSSVVLGGVISGTNGRSSGIGVVYSTDPNFGSFLTTSISTNVAAGTYTASISGLASSTTYYSKSYITNSAGTNYGNTVNFATAAQTIVTNGLILYLNANSYSSGTWSDLSTQNNNATLTGSPTFSSNPSSFTLASNKYALTSNLISSLSSATFIAWVNPSETQADYTGIIFSRASNSGASAPATGMNFFRNNSVGYSWNDNGSTWGWDSRLQTPVNSWSMIAITISSNSATAYLCKASGITTAVNTVVHSALTGLKFYVGADPLDLNTRAMKGKISTAMIYSSALSLSDITSIFNAQKASFGL